MKTIKVLSALPLEPEQIKKIEARFRSGERQEVRFEYIFDSALLGGIIVTDGNTVYDSSLKGKLNSLKQQLK